MESRDFPCGWFCAESTSLKNQAPRVQIWLFGSGFLARKIKVNLQQMSGRGDTKSNSELAVIARNKQPLLRHAEGDHRNGVLTGLLVVLGNSQHLPVW